MKSWVWLTLLLMLSAYAQDVSDYLVSDVVNDVPVKETASVDDASSFVTHDEVAAVQEEVVQDIPQEDLVDVVEEDVEEVIAEVPEPEPVVLYVSDVPLPESWTINQAELGNLWIYIPPGDEVIQLEVNSDNLFFRHALETLLSKQVWGGEAEVYIPPGEADVEVRLVYTDLSGEEKEASFATHLIVQGEEEFSESVVDMLPEGLAGDVLAQQAEVELAPVEEELTYADLSAQDIEALGLDPAEFVDGVEQLEQAELLEETGDVVGAEELRQAAEQELPQIDQLAVEEETYTYDVAVPVVEKFKEELKGNVHPEVNVDTRVFKVRKGGKEITKSKVHISVPAERDLKDVNLVVYIPKEIANSTSAIRFSEKPVILQDDPVVKWAFKNIPQDQHKDYTFTVDGDAQNFDTIAVAAAKKPGFLAKVIAWFVKKLRGKGPGTVTISKSEYERLKTQR